ncbi:MAG: ABC transporter permease [Elusimicrobiales bacterium]
MTFWNLYKKETGAYFNSPAAYVVMAAFLLTSGYLFAAPLFLANQASLSGFTGLAPLLLAFLAPAVTMRLFSEEFKTGTAELLLSLPADEWEIILSKLAAALTVFALTLALTLVYPVVIIMLGGLDTGAALCAYIGLMLCGMTLCSAGMLASVLTKSQVTAFIAGFMMTLFLYLVGKFSVFMSPPLAALADFAGIGAHLDNMSRGVVDSRDLVYFFSLSAFFLFLTRQKLKTMKMD